MMSSGMSGGGLSGMRGGGKVELARARDPRGSLSRLFGYLGPHRKALIGALLLAIGSTAASIFGPYILGSAVTELAQGAARQIGGAGAINFGRIGQILLTALALYTISSAFYYLHSWIMARVATDIAYRLRKEVSEKIHRLPLRYFDGVTRGEVLSRITNDVDTINQTLSQGMSQIVIALVTVVGVLVMMFAINWVMTLLALITVPLSMVASVLVLRRSHTLRSGSSKRRLGWSTGKWRKSTAGISWCRPLARKRRVCVGSRLPMTGSTR
jgi:ATP-binding cassette, subfamily B, multidrug efflux pump